MFNKLKNLSKGQMVTGGIAAAGIVADILMGDNNPFGTNKTTEYIWKFVEHDSIYSDKSSDAAARKYGYGPAPDLVGTNQSGLVGKFLGLDGSKGSVDHVNVVDNFAWTQSPKSSRDDVPIMMLREKKIQVNPQLNQIANNLYVAAEKSGRGAQQLKNVMPQELADKIKNNNVKAENELGGKILDFSKKIGGFMNQAAASKGGGGVLGPYENLYYTKDTGFVYSLPYMEEQFKNVGNTFGPGGDSQSAVRDAMIKMGVKASEAMRNVATGFNISDPGTYVEQPYLYDFGNRERKTYTCTFPLINTNSFNDVIKNWQLIFLLIYQNTPNRLTRDLIDPPCIYEANLDGTWYSKYSYVSRVDVKFLGATRRMSLPIPTEVASDGTGDINRNSFEVKTIIPDAYQVSVTLTEIFPETQNFLYHSVNQTNRRVTTEDRTTTFGLPTAVEKIQDAAGRILKDKLGF